VHPQPNLPSTLSAGTQPASATRVYHALIRTPCGKWVVEHAQSTPYMSSLGLRPRPVSSTSSSLDDARTTTRRRKTLRRGAPLPPTPPGGGTLAVDRVARARALRAALRVPRPPSATLSGEMRGGAGGARRERGGTRRGGEDSHGWTHGEGSETEECHGWRLCASRFFRLLLVSPQRAPAAGV